MVDFLKIWGTLIIALFALIQPWIRAIWKKLSWQQEVDVFETGSIEIGFSSYGPTVGLQGTLRSVHPGRRQPDEGGDIPGPSSGTIAEVGEGGKTARHQERQQKLHILLISRRVGCLDLGGI